MNEDDIYAKSLVLHNYLFGVELTDTVMLITEDKKVYFLSNKKKIEFLQQVMDAEDKGNFTFDFKIRDKSDGNEGHYKKFMKVIASSSANDDGKVRVGVFSKEWDSNMDTVNVAGLQKAIDDSDALETVDVGVGFGITLGVKDDEELDFIKKSSVLCNKVLKHGLVPRLEEVIDKEEKITHEALAEEIEAIYQDPSKINLKVPADQVSTAYFPIIQSGGEYDFRVSAVSNTKSLKYDVITVSLGSRYNNYCSNIARTFLVDPPKVVSDTYELLLQVHEACLEVMVPGKPLKTVYATAVQKLTDAGREDLVKCLPKNLGFSTGAYFREGSLALSEKNNITFKAGMTFNLVIGLSGIPLSEADRNDTNDASGVSIHRRLFVSWYTCVLTFFFSFHLADQGFE
jgi:nucleosome binding factor SPN SPT16 subunit